MSKYNQKILKQYDCLYNINNDDGIHKWNKLLIPTEMPNEVNSLSKNVYGLYGIIGNVAELVEDKNIVKGGGWEQKISEISISKNEPFKNPSNSIGFRNVCTFEVMKKTQITLKNTQQ